MSSNAHLAWITCPPWGLAQRQNGGMYGWVYEYFALWSQPTSVATNIYSVRLLAGAIRMDDREVLRKFARSFACLFWTTHRTWRHARFAGGGSVFLRTHCAVTTTSAGWRSHDAERVIADGWSRKGGREEHLAMWLTRTFRSGNDGRRLQMADSANDDHPRQTELSTGGLLPRLSYLNQSVWSREGYVYVSLPISHSICTRVHFAFKAKGLRWMFVFTRLGLVLCLHWFYWLGNEAVWKYIKLIQGWKCKTEQNGFFVVDCTCF